MFDTLSCSVDRRVNLFIWLFVGLGGGTVVA